MSTIKEIVMNTNSEKKNIILQPPMNKIHSVLRNMVCINTRNNSTIMTNVIFLIYTCISEIWVFFSSQD